MEGYLILMLIALLASAFFSCCETSFIVLDKIKLLVWKKRKDIYSRALSVFFPRQDRFIVTSLVGINIGNITFSSLAAYYLVSVGLPLWLIILSSTLIILAFAEVIPKTLALSRGSVLMRQMAVVFWLFYLLFYPIIAVFSLFSRFLFFGEESHYKNTITREVLTRIMVSPSSALTKKEAEIANSLLSLSGMKMREVLTPRTDIAAASEESSIDEIAELIMESGFSKIVIYRGDIDNILGYVHVMDLLNGGDSVANIIRPAVFVSEFTPVMDGFKILKDKDVGMLMVMDEYGGLDGIVTIEDLSEELFGDIEDEYDKPKFRHRRLKKGGFLISGRAEIDDLNRVYNFNLEKEEGVETFAGWLITNLGRIPKQNETLKIQDFKITVMLADEVRVKLVKVEKGLL